MVMVSVHNSRARAKTNTYTCFSQAKMVMRMLYEINIIISLITNGRKKKMKHEQIKHFAQGYFVC